MEPWLKLQRYMLNYDYELNYEQLATVTGSIITIIRNFVVILPKRSSSSFSWTFCIVALMNLSLSLKYFE